MLYYWCQSKEKDKEAQRLGGMRLFYDMGGGVMGVDPAAAGQKQMGQTTIDYFQPHHEARTVIMNSECTCTPSPETKWEHTT
jgi:hypothetical protein